MVRQSRLPLILSLLIASAASLPIPNPDILIGPGVSPFECQLVARDAATNGSVSGSAAGNSAPSFQSTTVVRAVNTALAGLAALLVGTTYYVLVKYSAPLFDGILVPTASLEANTGAVLGMAWNRDERASNGHDPLLFYSECGGDWAFVAKDDYQYPDDDLRHGLEEHIQSCGGRGLGTPSYGVEKLWSLVPPGDACARVTWMRTASSAMRNAVQLMVWEWLSLWLAAMMIVVTLIFNGFLTRTSTPDMWLRLVLVTAYAIANWVHLLFAWHNFLDTYTYITWHTCWVVVSKAGFAIGNVTPDRHSPDQDCHRVIRYDAEVLADWREVESWSPLYLYRDGLIRSNEDVYVVPGRVDRNAMVPEDIRKLQEPGPWVYDHDENMENPASTQIRNIHEAEIKTLEKATETALERVVMSTTLMLGIILANGLSPWTSSQLVDATSAILGSYALLLSVSSGVVALITSAAQLNNMRNAAAKILRLAEWKISYIWDESKKSKAKIDRHFVPAFGFTEKTFEHARGVGWGSLWRAMGPSKKWMSIIFGPGLALLPIGNEITEDIIVQCKVWDEMVQWDGGSSLRRVLLAGKPA